MSPFVYRFHPWTHLKSTLICYSRYCYQLVFIGLVRFEEIADNQSNLLILSIPPPLLSCLRIFLSEMQQSSLIIMTHRKHYSDIDHNSMIIIHVSYHCSPSLLAHNVAHCSGTSTQEKPRK